MFAATIFCASRSTANANFTIPNCGQALQSNFNGEFFPICTDGNSFTTLGFVDFQRQLQTPDGIQPSEVGDLLSKNSQTGERIKKISLVSENLEKLILRVEEINKRTDKLNDKIISYINSRITGDDCDSRIVTASLGSGEYNDQVNSKFNCVKNSVQAWSSNKVGEAKGLNYHQLQKLVKKLKELGDSKTVLTEEQLTWISKIESEFKKFNFLSDQ